MTKPKAKAAPANPFHTPDALSAMVRAGDERAIKYVIRMLKFCKGRVTKLAEELKISARTVYYWRDSNETLKAEFAKHALGLEGAGRALNEASVRARESKGAA